MDFDFEEKIEQIAKIPKPIRLAVVFSVLCGIVSAYYFTSYSESKETVQRLHAQSQQLQRQLNKVRIVASNVAEFEQEVADLERELELALTQLPNRKQFEDLLRDISIAGKRAGIGIKSITRSNEVQHDFYAEVPFALELEGSYHDVALFFERVSRLPRIVNIGTISMRVSKESDQSTTLNVSGRATTFRFLGEEDKTAERRAPQRREKA
jgi:type IV pilus assembly protein PilO